MPKSILYALFTIALWATGGVIGKLMNMSNYHIILFFTYLFAVVSFSFYLLQISTFTNIIQELKNIPLKWLFFAPLGYFFYWMFYQKTYASYEIYSQTASEAVVLNYTWPIFTLIFYNILYEHKKVAKLVQVIEYVAILISFIGIVILATNGDFKNIGNLDGLFYGLMTGASYGLFSAHSRTLDDSKQPIYLFVSIILSTIFMFIVLLNDFIVMKVKFTITLNDMIMAIVLGLFLDSIGYITWTKALSCSIKENIPLSTITSIIYLLPLLSLGLVAVYFGEKRFMDLYFCISVVCVLFGSVLAQNAERIGNVLKS